MGKFSNKLSLVPTKPGCYQMKNKDGVIIYVGKAKNLKRRLSSYFNKTQTGKTLMLVNDIDNFEYIVTSSEIESLILEITLIKKYNPKYNILLKDDKSYPYIEFNEVPYPTLKVVRNVKRKKNKNKLFGPYPNVKAAKRTVEILNRIYPLKKCNTMPKRECLYYHLGECLGYCLKENKKVDTTEMSKEIVSFLKGNHQFITDKIKHDMNTASENLNFEKAIELKQMLEDIEVTLKKQKIDLNNSDDFDLFNYYYHDNYVVVLVFFIRNGLLFGRDYSIFELFDSPSDAVLQYIVNFYEKNSILVKNILVPEDIDTVLLSDYLKVNITVPKKGTLKRLMDMAVDNAKAVLNEKEELMKKDILERKKALDDLCAILDMPNIHRIEAFDNSHLFGTFYVGGMVVFDDFIPNKNEYRKYKISLDVKDDLSAMREVIYRRYYRILMENTKKPDLIIVDGGKTQVAVAKEVIDSLNLNIRVVGLAKDDKHKTSVLIDSNQKPLVVDKHSNLFLFLNKIQDEVHRYAISYHRNIKSKGMFASVLDFVPGIGEIRKKELLKNFGSLKKIKEASIEDLEKILNKEIANNLYNYLQNLNGENLSKPSKNMID